MSPHFLTIIGVYISFLINLYQLWLVNKKINNKKIFVYVSYNET